MNARTAIPARLVIGVTGHRRLENEALIGSEVAAVVEKIKRLLPPLKNTPVAFTVLSPLAEGADRLVTRIVLEKAAGQLDVVLPLSKGEYAADFLRPESQAEFEELFSRARTSLELPPARSRTEAYANAGRYVVDNCDVLISIWDGEPGDGRGGTWETVQYARARGCPLFWIHAAGGSETTFEPGRGFDAQTLEELDEFNSERVNERRAEEKYRGGCELLEKIAAESGFPLARMYQSCSEFVSRYFRTDVLALGCQRLHYRAGSLVYILATGAVTIAAFQALCFPGWSFLALIEVILIGAVLAVVWLGQRRRWHAKWIDYRFLAERFRSGLFLAAAGIEAVVPRPPRHLNKNRSSREWMAAAFMSFLRGLPRPEKPGPAEFPGLRSFLVSAWIEGQIRYHQGTERRHRSRHLRLARAGNVLFGLTFVSALLHFVGLGGESLGRPLLLLAIVFPSIGAALGAVRTHREYLRNAQRSREIAFLLEELKTKMSESQDMESLLPLIREAEEIMLQENADWRVVVRFHGLEHPA